MFLQATQGVRINFLKSSAFSLDGGAITAGYSDEFSHSGRDSNRCAHPDNLRRMTQGSPENIDTGEEAFALMSTSKSSLTSVRIPRIRVNGNSVC